MFFGVATHAAMLYGFVPAVSLTAAAGPESLPISQLWRDSGDRSTPLRQHISLLDTNLTARGL